MTTIAPTDPTLAVSGLRISFRTDEGIAQVLDHVDLVIPRGKIVGVVGESGCGKSTLIRSILAVLPRTATVERGSITFEGEDLLALDQQAMSQRIRGKRISFIPQDPYLAFNPVFRVGTQLLEIMRWHGPESVGPTARRMFDRKARRSHRERLIELMRIVQIPEPEEALRRYPHQFSGGQRQRLLIAAALACRPALVIADEPTTALDVTTQLQILKLLKQLAAEFNVSMLFVTHDFGVVAQLCDEITVIYAGQSVESGNTGQVLEHPLHPYTRDLIDCHPDRSDRFIGIPGQVPSPLTPPSGCRFHPRCSEATTGCTQRQPVYWTDPGGHAVDCILYTDPPGHEARRRETAV